MEQDRGAPAPPGTPPGGRGGGAGGKLLRPRVAAGRRRAAPPARAPRPPPGRPAGAPQRPGGLRQDHPARSMAGRRGRPGGLGHPGRPRRPGLAGRPPGGRAAAALPRRRAGHPGPAAPPRRGGPRRPGRGPGRGPRGAGRRGRAGAGRLPGGARRGGARRAGGPAPDPPPGLRLVLATRADPPLPLARLRARGQVVELRAADLRFTPAEAAAFLARALPAPPAPGRSRRWSPAPRGGRPGCAWRPSRCRGRARTRARAAAFAGSHQPLALDYLLEEVFERQPAALQELLLRTAVPERLCAPLGDALLAGGPDLPPRAAKPARRGRTAPSGPRWRPCWTPTC